MADHRDQLRYPLTVRGRFTAGDPPLTVAVRLVDLSQAGVSFRSDTVIAIGARGRLEFTVLGARETVPVSAQILVQTCVLERHTHRIGAQFASGDADTAAQVALAVAARAAVVKGR